MEENQSPLLTEQQEPEKERAENAKQAVAQTEETAAGESAQQEAEESDTEENPDAQIPSFEGKTEEELKSMTDEELLTYLKEVATITPARSVRDAVDAIRGEVDTRFAKQEPAEKADSEADKEGEDQACKNAAEVSATETAIRELIKIFDAAVAAEKEEARKKMEANAEAKQGLLDQLTQVVAETQNENPSKLFGKVKDIIAQWKAIGHIPSSKKQLNKQFHSLTEEFFCKLNIDRALRDLDKRHNLEEKTKICEQAEALTTDPATRKAYAALQKLRDAWKAIGPAPTRAENDAIWERFLAASKTIGQNYHKTNVEMREKEKENYEVKKGICEEVEALLAKELTPKEIDGIHNKVQEFMARWKSVGFAPKSVNDEIYKRFRKGIDGLYDIRHAYMKEQNARFDANMRLKEALCEKAEAVMNSTDWRQTSNFLIGLQKEWKEVGPVSNRQSEAIWKRFRKACDTFFDHKQSQQEGELNEQNDNLAKKRAVIEELKAYAAPEDQEQHLKDLKAFVAKWNAIGMVPSKDRATVNKEFSTLIGKHYDSLNIDKAEAEMEQFRGHVEAMAAEGGDRLRRERNKLQNLVRQAEQAVETLENNIGFFKSKDPNKIAAEFNSKIAKAKSELEQLNKKMAIFNEVANR